MVTPVKWDKPRVLDLLDTYGYDFARLETPEGWPELIESAIGTIKNQCYARCLQMAYAFPDRFWYCEGLAEGIPHAWLSPKYYNDIELDSIWCIDFVWPWVYNDEILDNIRYTGLRFNGRKVVKFLKDKTRRTGYASISILSSVGEFELAELS